MLRVSAVFGFTLVAFTAQAETFRLVHAVGDAERVVERGLSEEECKARKREHVAVSEGLGIHSQHKGIGSITCLPESVFAD